MDIWRQISEEINRSGYSQFVVADCHAVSGGCISNAYRLTGIAGESFFVKTHEARYLEMFAAEAQGLQEMADSNSIRVPAVIACGVSGKQSYLVMEYLLLGQPGNDVLLGQQLAAMHRHTATQYGWRCNNTIGSNPQDNRSSEHWLEFWRSRRLMPQLVLAASNGYTGQLQDKGLEVSEQLDTLFNHYTPLPSLLHGDLWSGNYSYTEAGEPVLFDPACYYGDRETDLAMTELFGGFGQTFYAAYNDAWPLDSGYPVRKLLYNLYHILNHLNLFGSGYRSQAEQMMDRLLCEIR